MTIDGQPVSDVRSYVVASPVFRFRLPRKNSELQTKKRSGQAAAYGAGVIIRGLPVGSHTLRASGRFARSAYTADVTYNLTVTG